MSLSAATSALGRASLALFAMTASAGASAQVVPDSTVVSITGRVVDGLTQEGLPGSVVRIPEVDFAAITDREGLFSIPSIALGVYRMSVVKGGYDAAGGDVEVMRGGMLIFHLTPEAAPIQAGEGRIVGRVVDLITGEGLAGAEVRLPDTGQFRLTNLRGWFEFASVAAGPAAIEVELLGREIRRDTLQVPADELLDVEVPLAVEAIVLEGFTVTAHPLWMDRVGFFRRRERANAYSGRQWTREELDELDPAFVHQVLLQAPGVYPGGTRGGERVFYGRRRCRLKVFIDDFEIPNFDFDALDPDWIGAMEVYHGGFGSIPPEYSMRGACGVVLIWLERGG